MDKVSMNDIMNASLGEVSNKLEVTFKKTILVKSYETEVTESVTTVDLDHPVTGIERMFISAILEAQMEYSVYIQLATKGTITKKELADRKQALEEGLYSIKYKADQLLGVGVVDKYITYNDDSLKEKG